MSMSMMKTEDTNIFASAVTVGILGTSPSPLSSKATKEGDDYSNMHTRRPKTAKAKEGVDAAMKDDNKKSKTGKEIANISKSGKELSIAAAAASNSTSIMYAKSGKNPEALPSQLSSPSILPYFGGTDGETCRRSTVNAWKATNTPFKNELDAVISTNLYQTAKSYCQSQIDLLNIASGVVCLLEQGRNYNLSYGEFWMNGDIYFDGDYDLASLFLKTANFTEVGGDTATCLADCYTGGPGCIDLSSWLVNYGQVSVEQYCNLQWGQIDTMYNEIKICAAKAISNPLSTGMTQLEYVNEFRYQLATQQECSYKSCFPELDNAIVATSCPSITTNPPTNDTVIDPPREIPTVNNGVYEQGAVTEYTTSIIILLVGTWLVW